MRKIFWGFPLFLLLLAACQPLSEAEPAVEVIPVEEAAAVEEAVVTEAPPTAEVIVTEAPAVEEVIVEETQPEENADWLPELGPAAEIDNDVWINSPPLTMAELKGKVVLVEFWTFG